MPIDRKALADQYKRTPRTVGVGMVRNTASGRALLLASKDISALLNRHRGQLRLAGHPNRALQADWNDLGEAAFEFTVLDVLTPTDAPAYDPTEDLRTLEAMWIDKLQPFEPAGYHPRRE